MVLGSSPGGSTIPPFLPFVREAVRGLCYNRGMKSFPSFCLAAVCAFAAGCFDNRGKPADATPVTSLKALAATNRADVTRLYLRGSAEAVGDGAFSDLPNLRQLDISELKLKAVPSSVFGLKALEHLYLARNQLEAVPDALGAMPALTYLNLDGNRLAAVPASLAGAKALRWLRLNENRLQSLPPELGALTEMRRIYLKRNQLAAVPEVVKAWPLLEDLLLDGNPIETLPDWVTALPKLKSVSFADCKKLAKLPDDLSGWRGLESLVLSGCPIPADEAARIRKALGDDVAVVF